MKTRTNTDIRQLTAKGARQRSSALVGGSHRFSPGTGRAGPKNQLRRYSIEQNLVLEWRNSSFFKDLAEDGDLKIDTSDTILETKIMILIVLDTTRPVLFIL